MRKYPTADISLEDAHRLGLKPNDWIRLYNAVGSIEVAVNPSGKIRPGDVHLYHGYSEANANDLVGSFHLDPYSGFPGYKSNRCNIEKIPVPQRYIEKNNH